MQVIVARYILEAQATDVAEVLADLLCCLLALFSKDERTERSLEAVAEVVDRVFLLLLAKFLVLLLVSSSPEALPWKIASEEIYENVTQSFQVVSARLLASNMSLDIHVTRRTSIRLAFPVRDVLFRLGVTMLLSHTKIHNVNRIGALRAGLASKEIFRLDVAVDKILLMDGLNSRQMHIV